MNFLAHAYLSGEDNKILLGNFIGDFIKGRLALNELDTEIVRGVELHRAIDAYTDHHAVVHKSKERLRQKYRHYAGVIVDVFYDHFLAAHWPRFHHQPLSVFARNTYEAIQAHSEIVPDRFRQMLPYMIRENWLLSYGEVQGIHRALAGMARRSPYNSKMEQASTDLKQHYEEFDSEFLTFFPDLKLFAEQWQRTY